MAIHFRHPTLVYYEENCDDWTLSHSDIILTLNRNVLVHVSHSDIILLLLSQLRTKARK